jgi:hypothetical protein
MFEVSLRNRKVKKKEKNFRRNKNPNTCWECACDFFDSPSEVEPFSETSGTVGKIKSSSKSAKN